MVRIRWRNARSDRDVSIGEWKSNLAPPSSILAIKMEERWGWSGGLRCLFFILGSPPAPKTTDTTINQHKRTCGAGRRWAGIIYLTHKSHFP